MIRSAVLSSERRYRYRLERSWGATPSAPAVLFIMLNPSTADATIDDPTIRRCMVYARDWGYERLLVGNIYALRATDPRELRRVQDPNGPENNSHLIAMAGEAAKVVVAWGSYPAFRPRGDAVGRMLRGFTLWALKLARNGNPCHPLYLRKDAELIQWRAT